MNPWVLVIGIAAFIGYRFIRSQQVKNALPGLIAQGGMIVDVRSAAEFASASNPKSLNIPLDQLPQRISELPKDKPIILCCASGARSGMALGILKAKGFQTVLNAGAWTNTL